jgi:hypothetical protein
MTPIARTTRLVMDSPLRMGLRRICIYVKLKLDYSAIVQMVNCRASRRSALAVPDGRRRVIQVYGYKALAAVGRHRHVPADLRGIPELLLPARAAQLEQRETQGAAVSEFVMQEPQKRRTATVVAKGFFCYHRDRPGSVRLREELLEEH